MAQPKRKSPEKAATTRKASSRFARLLAAGVAAISRHPRSLGGGTVFCVIFSFVAANALWYQPRHHPSPLLATRVAPGETRIATLTPADEFSDAKVTTFRIERQGATTRNDASPEAVRPVASALVRQVQQALAERGLYGGPVDGLPGPRTTSAILFFQETEGLEQTGEASAPLLARIRAHNPAVAVDDATDQVPSNDVTASTKVSSSDDIAALINQADAESVTAIPVAKPHAAAPAAEAVPVDTVMKIQKALTRFAYANVKVDGVAGAATRAAIRAFEKSYDLPVTGEPSERVLKKLAEIGAL
jgi:peptidoglycan hydrolase-like protein with peptidoglycan-binding domain